MGTKVHKFYMTKNRKRKFNLIYNSIEWLKNTIYNIEIEIKSHIRHNRQLEYMQSKKILVKYEKKLLKYEKNGHEPDYIYKYITKEELRSLEKWEIENFPNGVLKGAEAGKNLCEIFKKVK